MDPVTNRLEQRIRDRRRLPEGLARGLPNFWYPVLQSGELRDTPVKIERFGENLAVWRGESHAPRIFENHCPHRRAPLSLGRIDGDELMCAYHGWRFNGAGDCVGIPLEDPSPAALARHTVKSYPAAERGGYVWMFYGDHEDVTPLVLPSELEDADWLGYRADYVWDTNWMNILDNVMDPIHAIFLHAGAVTQRKRAKFKGFTVTREDERGFSLGKLGLLEDGSVGPVEGEVEFLLPNIVRLDIADGTANGVYRVLIMPTPIDEGRACAFYFRARRTTDLWSRLRWQAWWAMHGRQVHKVAAEDREILSGIEPIAEARPKEHLASSDMGVVNLRRKIQAAFEQPPKQSG